MVLIIKSNPENRELYVYTAKPLPNLIKKEFLRIDEKKTPDGEFLYTFGAFPNQCFILYHLIQKVKNVEIDNKTQSLIKQQASLANDVKVYLYSTEKHIAIECPSAPFYMEIIRIVKANEQGLGVYTVPLARAHEVLRVIDTEHKFLPKFTIDKSILKKVYNTLLNENNLSSLFTTPIEKLHTVNTAYQTPVSYFNKAGYNTVSDLVFKRPKRYIDKTTVLNTLKNTPLKETVNIIGVITKKKISNYKHSVLYVSLGTETVDCWFFNRSWVAEKFSVGEEVLIQGEYNGENRISGQQCDSLIEAQTLPIVPIYPQSVKNKMTTRLLMNSAYEAIARIKAHNEDLGDYIDKDLMQMSFVEALEELHFPNNIDNYKKAIHTLAYFEMIALQLIIEDKKINEVKSRGLPKPKIIGGLQDQAEWGLPFKLTSAQQDAIKQIGNFMSKTSAETMLLSADVGSGKTLITQLACLQCVDNGYQAVLCGPTEVLAQQLYNTFVKLLNGIKGNKTPKIVYLGGSVKGTEKKNIIKAIKHGEVDIIVGTHTVLGDSIEYCNLGLVVVDEQQKFGKNQRENLKNKRKDGLSPDIIEQTATPIPQSTASAFYRHINLISIEGKPEGRIPIITEWIKTDPKQLLENKNNSVWEDIEKEINKGHQVFCVLPLVYESEKLNVASVEEASKKLKKIFPKIPMSIVHGGQKKTDQQEEMEKFRNNETKIMIASVVIEVGVDIPNATRIVILNADRLGAAQLHQIRGRVGRSNLPSKCYLVSEGLTDNSKVRLQSLVDYDNGFEIAKIDLKTRGHGDIFGTKQSGENSLRFANLIDHSELIANAQKEAVRLFKSKEKPRALADAYALIKSEEDDEDVAN